MNAKIKQRKLELSFYVLLQNRIDFLFNLSLILLLKK